MADSMHQRYDEDERALIAAASETLWSDARFDAVVDVAGPLLEASAWHGLPEGASPLWAERATAAGALAAISLRAARTGALAVRAGYAAEALASVRRMMEAAGHAQRVASDESGQYAENWLGGRGRADRPRTAFGGDPADDLSWELMSGASHAEFAAFAAFSTKLDDGQRLLHFVGPSRDEFWDPIWLWMVARQLLRTLACLLIVHPAIDQREFLEVGTRLVEAEQRIDRATSERRRLDADGRTGED